MIELKILNSGDIQFSVTDMKMFSSIYGSMFSDKYNTREWCVFDPLCRENWFDFHSSGEELDMLYSGPVIFDTETDRLWYDDLYAVRDAVDELLQGCSVVYTLYKE